MEIEGFENYLIYPDGKVWSKCTQKYLKQKINSRGYYHVMLYKGSRKTRKTKVIHRLVALQYIPNPDNLEQVDHINREKTDNRIENLRWVNSSQNNINKKSKGLIPHKNISFNNTNKLYKVYIKRKTQVKVFEKWSKTLEEALEIRDLWFIENGEEIPD